MQLYGWGPEKSASPVQIVITQPIYAETSTAATLSSPRARKVMMLASDGLTRRQAWGRALLSVLGSVAVRAVSVSLNLKCPGFHCHYR